MTEILDEVSRNTGIDRDTINHVADELFLQLHRAFVESNKDLVGQELWHQLSSQAFYHLLGMLEEFSNRYEWEQGTASEYLMRLGSQAHWLPYFHQTEAWNRSRSS